MKVSRQKVSRFLACPRNFLYENLRWGCSNMDLRESIWDSAKDFCEGLRVQLAEKLFCQSLAHVISSSCKSRNR